MTCFKFCKSGINDFTLTYL